METETESYSVEGTSGSLDAKMDRGMECYSAAKRDGRSAGKLAVKRGGSRGVEPVEQKVRGTENVGAERLADSKDAKMDRGMECCSAAKRDGRSAGKLASKWDGRPARKLASKRDGRSARKLAAKRDGRPARKLASKRDGRSARKLAARRGCSREVAPVEEKDRGTEDN